MTPENPYYEWQSIVLPGVPLSRKASKRQLTDASKLYIENSHRIISDCTRLLNNTCTPSVYFERYDLMIDRLKGLSVIEKYLPLKFFNGNPPSLKLLEFERVYEQATNSMIDRCWQKTLWEASRLKTPQGQQNRVDSFFENLRRYTDKMWAANMALIESKHKIIALGIENLKIPQPEQEISIKDSKEQNRLDGNGSKSAPEWIRPRYKSWWIWAAIITFIFVIVVLQESSPTTPSYYPILTEKISETESLPIIEEGMYKIGEDIAAGEYKLFSLSNAGAYMEITSDSTGSLDSIVANDNFDTFTYIAVDNGQYLNLKRACAISVDDIEPYQLIDDMYVEGTYLVGYDMPAGEYELEASSTVDGYWERSSDCSHTFDSIIANDNFDNSCYVTVYDGEYFKLTRAYIVTD